MKVTFDTTAAADAYRQAFRRLGALEGFHQKDILRAEAGVILKSWAGSTSVTTEDKAELRMRKSIARKLNMQNMHESPFGITINDGSRGGERGYIWFRTQGTSRMTKKGKQAGRPFQLVGAVYTHGFFSRSWLHYRDADWEPILEGVTRYANTMQERRPKVMKSLGFSRQSVVQIADDLGIDLNSVQGGRSLGGGMISAQGIAKAKAAIASNGSQYKNGSGVTGGDDVKAYVDLINRLPYNRKIGMDATLARIVSGRAAYIETSYKKGAFDSIQKVARAFPNLIRTTGMNVPAAEAA